MPIYEYRCAKCGKISEFILKFDEAPTQGCKHCGETKLERVQFSTFAVGANSAPSCGSSCDYSSLCNQGHCCGPNCKH